MNPKTILTEDGWDDVAPDYKGKDKDLRKGFAAYSSLKEDDFDLRCKALIKIAALAGTLKAANEVKGNKDAVKHLADVINATKLKQSELAKAKAEAEKAKVMVAKKADAETKKQEEEEGSADEEEEEEEGDSLKKLTNALKTLRLSKKPYYFLVCDAKPYGLIVSKKDIRKNMQARKELAQIAGGSTRPPKFGECRCDSGKYVFEMEKPPSGLARILQKWIKTSTGLGLKVMVGTESADDDEAGTEDMPAVASAPSAQASAAADKAEAAKQAAEKAAAAKQAALETKALEERRTAFKKARATWIAVKAKAEADLEKVKDGARMHYLADPKQFPKIVKGCKEIDAILDNLDDELRDTLDQYAATPLTNQAKLHTLSAAANEVLDRYYEYVAADPIMKAIDKKEFADVTVHAPIMKALGDLRKALS